MEASLFALAKFMLVLFLPPSIKENFDNSQGSIFKAATNGINIYSKMDWKKLTELNNKNPVITGIIHDYHLFPDSPQSNTMQLKDPGTAVSIDMCHLNFNTNDNQRLGSVGAICWRSKCSCSSAMLCISFTWQKVKMCLIRLWVIEGVCIICEPASQRASESCESTCESTREPCESA